MKVISTNSHYVLFISFHAYGLKTGLGVQQYLGWVGQRDQIVMPSAWTVYLAVESILLLPGLSYCCIVLPFYHISTACVDKLAVTIHTTKVFPYCGLITEYTVSWMKCSTVLQFIVCRYNWSPCSGMPVSLLANFWHCILLKCQPARGRAGGLWPRNRRLSGYFMEEKLALLGRRACFIE